jgi:hypothetical protein
MCVSLDGSMDERVNGSMDELLDRWTNALMGVSRMDRCVGGEMCG